MTGRLYRTELALLARDARVRWIGIILLVLLVATFALSWVGARSLAAESREVAATERARWLGQDPQNPHSAAHYGVWVFKQPSPLAVLDPGIDPYVGRMVRIEAHKLNDAIFRSAQDTTPLARTGSGTVADIVHLVAPLAAILLGFSAFAADRERGTLRLALGNGASPGRILTARFAALATVLAGIVGLPILLLGLAAATTLDGGAWQAGGRAVLWAVAEFGYVLVFLALAVAASLIARTARAALTVSLMAWALFCVAAPRLAATGVEAIAPTPSQQAVLARIDQEIMLFKRADNHAAREAALLARYCADTPEQMPISLRGALLHIQEQHDYAVYDQHLGAFNAALDRQDQLFGWAGILSPMVAVQSVSQALAGTDYRRHVDFLNDAEAYRRVLSDTMNLDLMANPDADYVGDRGVWEKVPDFAYAPASVARSVADAAVPIAILALWLALAAGLAAAAARRIKP